MGGVVDGVDEGRSYAGWRVVGAAFLVAMFGWGFAFYGLGVYIAALHARHGWAIAPLAGAVTGFYLLGAVLITRVAAAIERFGPRSVVGAGVLCMCGALGGIASSSSPWHFVLALVPLALAWSAMSSAAITILVAPWFVRRQGLALGLALTGASVGGVLVVPALVLAIDRYGLARSLPLAAVAMLAVLAPALLAMPILPAAAPAHRAAGAPPAGAPVAGGGAGIAPLRDPRFWSIAAPFACGLLAQVGFLTHQVALLQPVVGASGAALGVGLTTGAALAGRLATGWAADRVGRRRLAATSFLLQAASLVPAIVDWSPATLYLACVGFGLGVGNMITLPGLIVREEFPARHLGRTVAMLFGFVQVVYAFGPSLIGALHDALGGYRGPVALCAGLIALAAALVLRRPPSERAGAEG